MMAEGQERAELLDLDSTEPALIGEVLLTSEQEADVDGAAAEAMSRILKEKLDPTDASIRNSAKRACRA